MYYRNKNGNRNFHNIITFQFTNKDFPIYMLIILGHVLCYNINLSCFYICMYTYMYIIMYTYMHIILRGPKSFFRFIRQ